jgi:uncharacterized protein (TIGR03437 family)
MLQRCAALLFAAAFVPSLFAQTHCDPVRFSGATYTQLLSADGSQITGLLRNFDGTFDSYTLTTTAPYSLVKTTKNDLGLILPCGVTPPAGTPMGGLPVLAEYLSRPGVSSQTIAVAPMSSTTGVLAFLPKNATAVEVFSGGLGAKEFSETTYPAGSKPVSVILTDLNGDSVPDLIVLDAGGGADAGGVYVFFGSAAGTFQFQAAYPAGAQPVAMTAADFNGDGKPDLAVANSNSENISVLLNKGNGSFLPARNFDAGVLPATIAAADFNGDGKLDLITAGGPLGMTAVLLGNGDGTFNAPSGPRTVRWDAGFVATGDFNGDGKIDAVFAGEAGVAVELGRGDGTFGPPAYYLAGSPASSLIVTDIDGDSKQDILVASGDPLVIAGDPVSDGVSVLLGNGDGTFQASALAYLPASGVQSYLRMESLAVADFNGDGQTDAVSAESYSGQVYLFPGLGSGAFGAPLAIASIPAISAIQATSGDYNGDGMLDLAFATTSTDSIGQVTVMLSAGGGKFLPPASFSSAGSDAVAIATADFNGDGHADLMVANSNGVAVFFGDGNGAFNLSKTYLTSVASMAALAADFNGDGKPDIAAVGNAGGTGSQVDLLLNKGDGTFTAAAPVSLTAFATLAAAGDFNGDGALDLAVTIQNADRSYSVVTLLNNRAGGFRQSATSAIQGTPMAMLARDFNHDGRGDVVIASSPQNNGFTGSMSVLVGDGDGTFQPESVLASGIPVAALAAAGIAPGHDSDLVFVEGPQINAVAAMLNVSPGQAAATVNGASFAANAPVARSSIASVFGLDLATKSETASGTLGTDLAGTSVQVTDSNGVARKALLFYVSPKQVNFLMPDGVAYGAATIAVTSGDGKITTGGVSVAPVAPGIFVANSGGLAAATLVRVHADGTQTQEAMEQVDPNTGQIVPVPIDLDPQTDTVYLELFGTGFRNAKEATVQIAGQALKPSFAGAQPTYSGLDQLNVALPYSLKGSGDVTLTVSANGIAANPVHVVIQ